MILLRSAVTPRGSSPLVELPLPRLPYGHRGFTPSSPELQRKLPACKISIIYDGSPARLLRPPPLRRSADSISKLRRTGTVKNHFPCILTSLYNVKSDLSSSRNAYDQQVLHSNSLRMNPGEVVLKRLAAIGGKALPDVGVYVLHRAGVLGQIPERKRRLPRAVRPRDYMAYRSLGHFFHLPILYHNFSAAFAPLCGLCVKNPCARIPAPRGKSAAGVVTTKYTKYTKNWPVAGSRLFHRQQSVIRPWFDTDGEMRPCRFTQNGNRRQKTCRSFCSHSFSPLLPGIMPQSPFAVDQKTSSDQGHCTSPRKRIEPLQLSRTTKRNGRSATN